MVVLEGLFYLVVLAACVATFLCLFLCVAAVRLLVKLSEQPPVAAPPVRKLRGPYMSPESGLRDIETAQISYSTPPTDG